METTSGPEVPLWPEGAVPLATGSSRADRPALSPFLVRDGGGTRGAVIVCPGGGYSGLAPHEGEPVARWLNALGLHALVLRYRVAPYRHPAPLLDAQRAVRAARQRAEAWGIDPERVGVLGFSAGGHLAALTGTLFDGGDSAAPDPVERRSSRPDFLVLCYPVISLVAEPHRGSVTNLLGEDPSEDRRLALSAERLVTAETPPTFVWHTADDAGVPVAHSLAYADALARHRVPFDLHVFTHGRHGLGLAGEEPHVRGWTAACATWLAVRGLDAAKDAH